MNLEIKMSQITLTINEETESVIQQLAQSENLAPSQWLSQFIERQIKQNQEWSPEVKALSGSWADFPSLAEIRGNDTLDSTRESL